MALIKATTAIANLRHRLVYFSRSYVCVSKLFPWPYHDPKTNLVSGRPSSLQLFQLGHLLQPSSPGTVYMMPMLTKSLKKLRVLIEKEMDGIGAQEVCLPCLSPASLWQSSGRWDEMGAEMFKFTDRKGIETCLSPTHEEAITTMVAATPYISYKYLPIKLYQIGRKFRDEMRPKNGLLRGREFEMKDLYTFDKDQEHALGTYEEVTQAYCRLFDLLEVDYHRVHASSGAMGGDLSHEFHLASPQGEDTLYKCTNCGEAYNEELLDMAEYETIMCKKNPNEKCNFEKLQGIEIAHSFVLGEKYSDVFNAQFKKSDNMDMKYYMACYGIGVTRLLASLVEVLSTDSCIRWPKRIAPYQIAIVPQHKEFQFELAKKLCKNLSETIPNISNDVLLDDRVNLSVAKRSRQINFLGIPYIVILGKNCSEDNPQYEFINVTRNTTEFLDQTELMERCREIGTMLS